MRPPVAIASVIAICFACFVLGFSISAAIAQSTITKQMRTIQTQMDTIALLQTR